nr:type II toxin-antitoxin system YafQ family toxin [Allorhizobium ampelinum]
MISKRRSVRKIEQTGQFKRDLKRESKGRYRAILEDELLPVIAALAQDEVLEARYRDHALTGEWKDHRDCHVKPDLVLIYRKPDAERLQLVRLGSHSELGL